jgi:hypothetical protein
METAPAAGRLVLDGRQHVIPSVRRATVVAYVLAVVGLVGPFGLVEVGTGGADGSSVETLGAVVLGTLTLTAAALVHTRPGRIRNGAEDAPWWVLLLAGGVTVVGLLSVVSCPCR